MANDDYHTISDSEFESLENKSKRLSELTWRSIESELPQSTGSYLAFLGNTFICMVFFDSDKKWMEMWGCKELDVRYWMMLPDHPYHINHF